MEPMAPNTPTPPGSEVTLIHYFDANLMHVMISRNPVTRCIHLANKTPLMWHSKKQTTTETATFGAEFIAARTYIEQIIDLRNSLRYLGVNVTKTSYMFRDNTKIND